MPPLPRKSKYFDYILRVKWVEDEATQELACRRSRKKTLPILEKLNLNDKREKI